MYFSRIGRTDPYNSQSHLLIVEKFNRNSLKYVSSSQVYVTIKAGNLQQNFLNGYLFLIFFTKSSNQFHTAPDTNLNICLLVLIVNGCDWPFLLQYRFV